MTTFSVVVASSSVNSTEAVLFGEHSLETLLCEHVGEFDGSADLFLGQLFNSRAHVEGDGIGVAQKSCNDD